MKDYLYPDDEKELQRDKEIMTILAVADGIVEGRTDRKIAAAHLDDSAEGVSLWSAL